MLQTDDLYHRCNPPVFKLAILLEEGPDSRGVVLPTGVGVSLLCRDCLTEAIEGMPETLLRPERHVPPVPELAYMVLPLRLTKEQVKLLRQEITEEVQESSKLAA